jgi:hypothetical protein
MSIAMGAFSQELKQPQTTTETKQPQGSTPAQATPQENKTANLSTIKGTVKEVAADKTYIVVDSTKILTTKEFLAESYLEVGDKVEITTEKTNDGLKAVTYNYVFDEEPADESGAGSLEEPSMINTEEMPSKE